MSQAFLTLINISFNLNIYWSFISLFWHGFLLSCSKDVTLTTSRTGSQSDIKQHVYEHILSPFVKFILLYDKQVLQFFWWEIRSSISHQLGTITFLIPWMLQISFLISTTLQLNIKYDLLGSTFQTFKCDCYFISAIPSMRDAEFMSNSVSRRGFQTFFPSYYTIS